MAIDIQTTDDLITRESLIANVGSIPAYHDSTKYRRVCYVLSILRGHANGLIAKAARSLYDGSISAMARRKATSTPEAVVSAVLERAHADLDELEREQEAYYRQEAARQEAATAEWVASLSAPELPLDLFPDSLLLPSQMTAGEQALADVLDVWPVSGLFESEPEREVLVLYDAAQWLRDGALVELTSAEYAEVVKAFQPFPPDDDPEPTSPASAPVVIAVEPAEETLRAVGLAQLDAWIAACDAQRYEQEQAFWRDYEAKRTQIADEAGWRVEALCEGLDVLDDDILGWFEEESAEYDAYMSVAA